MKVLKVWKNKGVDLTCEGLSRGLSKEKDDALYPYRKHIKYKRCDVNYATIGVGIRERIKVVDDAIIAASKV